MSGCTALQCKAILARHCSQCGTEASDTGYEWRRGRRRTGSHPSPDHEIKSAGIDPAGIICNQVQGGQRGSGLYLCRRPRLGITAAVAGPGCPVMMTMATAGYATIWHPCRHRKTHHWRTKNSQQYYRDNSPWRQIEHTHPLRCHRARFGRQFPQISHWSVWARASLSLGRLPTQLEAYPPDCHKRREGIPHRRSYFSIRVASGELRGLSSQQLGGSARPSGRKL